MKNDIIFETLYIEGFQSIIKPFTYKLNEPGINIILGKNGVGKSTILNAFTWAAYNQMLKAKSRVEPWKSIRPKDFQGTKVGLKFRKGKRKYEVINCKSYKGELEGAKGGDRMLLYVNGVYQEKFRDKGDIKKEIAHILGKSFDLFKNSVVFGQKLKRIISEDGPKKKEIFEEAFEVAYINVAKKIGEEELKVLLNNEREIQAKVERLDHKYKLAKKDLENYKEQLNSGESRIELLYKIIANKKKELKSLKKKDIKSLKAHGLELENEHNRLSKLCEPLLKSEQEDFKLDMGIVNLQGDIANLKSDYKNLLGSKLKTKCPECGQMFKDLKARKKHRSNKLKSLKEQISLKQKEIKSDQTKRLKFGPDLKKLSDYNMLRKELSTQMHFIGIDILNCKEYPNKKKAIIKDINEAKVKLSNINIQKIIDLKNKALKNKNRYKDLIKPEKDKLKDLKIEIDNYRWVINEPLSNSGMKAFVFNQMLKQVNRRLLYYSEYTGFIIKFFIDLKSARKDFKTSVFFGEEEIDYNELSGGQSQLTDVCLAFSIHDVVNETSGCNVFILDEVFESLDEDNVELIAELIKAKGINKSIHIITHLKDFVVQNSNCLRLKLDKHRRTVVSA